MRLLDFYALVPALNLNLCKGRNAHHSPLPRVSHSWMDGSNGETLFLQLNWAFTTQQSHLPSLAALRSGCTDGQTCRVDDICIILLSPPVPVPLCSLPPILPGSQCPHLSPTIKTLRKVSSLSLLHMSMKESTEGLSMTVRETWLHVALPLRTLDKTLSLWVSEFPSLKRGGFVWISSWDLSGYYSLICERKETDGSNHYCSQWKEMVGWWGRRTQSNKRGKIGGRERGIEWGRKEGREAGGKEGRSLEAFENFLMHQAKYFENFRQHYSLYSTYYMVLVYCLNHKLHANGLIHKPLTFFMSP